MNSLPTTSNNNFFSKIRRFFLNLFKKNKKEEYIEVVKISKESKTRNKVKIDKNEEQEIFINELQKSGIERKIKDDIIKQINSEPDLIEEISYDRLYQLEGIYNERINEVKRENEELEYKIKKLKLQLENG